MPATLLITAAALLSPRPAAAQSTAKSIAQSTAQSAITQPNRTSQIRQILKDYSLPGIQLIYTHDKHTETYNLGTTGDSTHPITPSTIFEAASLSKSVFTYIVLRLYDRGLINLDTSLLAYIGTYDRFDPDNPAYAKITARMVLSHRTGLPNWGDSDRARLIFPPDSCFSYSGEGFLFLQHVVEKITGKTLNDLARQEAFTPLKMTSSSYTWQPRFDSVSAFGNSPEAIKNHSGPNAASSLLTNAHDYTLFLKAIAKGQGLKPETHKMMLTPATSARWFHHTPNEAMKHIFWGLGVGLQDEATSPSPKEEPTGPGLNTPTPDPNNYPIPHPPHLADLRGRAFWHWGDNGDFKAYYIAYPNTHESLVYFVHNWRGLFAAQDLYNLFIDKTPCWSIIWSGEGYHSPQSMKTFSETVEEEGFDKAAEVMKEKNLAPPEDDLNEYGFLLMNKKRPADAVAIFKLNLGLHPESANAFDSLAEGYEALGDKALALENFKRSLALNPKNEYAAKHIKNLETDLQTK